MANEQEQSGEDFDVPQEAIDALNHDPFAPGDDELNPSDATGVGSDGQEVSAEESTSASDGTQDGDASSQEEKGTEADNADVPAKADGEPEPKKDEDKASADGAEEEVNEGILALLAAASQNQQTPTQASGDAEKTQEDKGKQSGVAETPSYEFQIPDQLVNLLGSESTQERAQGIQLLTKGVGQAIHKQVMGIVESKISAAKQEVARDFQSNSQSMAAAQEIHNDYYGKFPTHNHPSIKPIVQSVTAQVVAETGSDTWGPNMRNAIGAKVNELLRKAGVLTKAGAGVGGGGGSPNPPKATQQGTRAGATSSGDPNSMAEIEKTLFG